MSQQPEQASNHDDKGNGTRNNRPAVETGLTGADSANVFAKPPQRGPAQHEICALEGFRAQTVRDLLERKEVVGTVVFDDLYHTVGVTQRKELVGLAGYTRCLLPALELGIAGTAHVIVLTPPFLQELDSVTAARAMLSESSALQVWYRDPKTEEWLDLLALSQSLGGRERIERLIEDTIATPPDFKETLYPTALSELFAAGKIVGKHLLMPFQTRDVHSALYEQHIAEGQVVLLDSAERFVDKAQAAKILCTVCPSVSEIFTRPEPVEFPTSHSEVFYVSETLKARCLRNPAAARFLDFAARIIERAEEKESAGRLAYIKLDASGVSGLGNLSPATYPEVYNSQDRESRIWRVASLLAERYATVDAKEVPFAVVEDRIERSRDSFGVREYVAGGILIGGKYYPTSFTRAINDDSDVFQGVIGSADATRVGISEEELLALGSSVQRIAEAQVEAGYRDGLIAKDFMYDQLSGLMKVHDHNDRRGGRSHLERMIMLHPEEVFMDRDFTFHVPSGESYALFVRDLLDRAKVANLNVYGTSTLYYPERSEQGLLLKLKIVAAVPSEILARPANVVQEMEQFVREQLRAHPLQ